MPAVWGTITLDPGGVIGDSLATAEQLVDSIQSIISSVQTVLEAVRGPAELVERFIRTLFDPVGFDLFWELLAAALAQIVANFLEADIWLLPLWPQNLERLYGTWNRGPTSIADFQNTIQTSLDSVAHPGVDWVSSTLRTAVEDLNDPYRPRLGENAYTGGVVLLVGAEHPEDLLVYQEALEFATGASDVASFFRSISANYSRYTNFQVRSQGTWPDFRRLIFAEVFPPFSDYLRRLQDFISAMSGFTFTYVGALIDAITELLDFIDYILGIIDGVLTLLQILASIQFTALAITIEPRGMQGFIDEIDNSLEKPDFNYVAGMIVLVGSENLAEIEPVYQIVTSLLPVAQVA